MINQKSAKPPTARIHNACLFSIFLCLTLSITDLKLTWGQRGRSSSWTWHHNPVCRLSVGLIVSPTPSIFTFHSYPLSASVFLWIPFPVVVVVVKARPNRLIHLAWITWIIQGIINVKTKESYLNWNKSSHQGQKSLFLLRILSVVSGLSILNWTL